MSWVSGYGLNKTGFYLSGSLVSRNKEKWNLQNTCIIMSFIKFHHLNLHNWWNLIANHGLKRNSFTDHCFTVVQPY